MTKIFQIDSVDLEDKMIQSEKQITAELKNKILDLMEDMDLAVNKEKYGIRKTLKIVLDILRTHNGMKLSEIIRLYNRMLSSEIFYSEYSPNKIKNVQRILKALETIKKEKEIEEYLLEVLEEVEERSKEKNKKELKSVINKFLER